MSARGVDGLECPVCLDPMTAPILQCQGGHSLCSTCSDALVPPICPLCRQNMTKMRNWTLEAIIASAAAERAAARSPRAPAPARAGVGAARARLPCPHHNEGCSFVFTKPSDAEEHALECIFRDMLCPHGAAFSNCFWIGKLKQMVDHFKEKHPGNWSTFPVAAGGATLELCGVGTRECRHVFLAAQGNMHFIVTFRVDTKDNTACWAVQHVGSKKHAGLYTYEIHVLSKQDGARRAVLSERCFNDVVATDEVFRLGRCAALPLRLLPLYIKDEKLAFRFVVRKTPLASNIANLQIDQ